MCDTSIFLETIRRYFRIMFVIGGYSVVNVELHFFVACDGY